MRYAIVGSDGSNMRLLGDFPPREVTLMEGEQVSYKGMLFGITWATPPEISMKIEGAQGRAWRTGSEGAFHIWVWGTNIQSIENIREALTLALGGHDLTPKYPNLPAMSSAFKRFMYLVRYVVSGQIE